MDHFTYKDGQLFAEDVAVADIAAQVGTPVYIYSQATFLDHLKKIQDPKSYLLIEDIDSLPAALPKIVESLIV